MDLTAAGFGASLTDVLPDLRVMAESRMLDTCAIKYQTGTTTDPVTGSDTPVYTTRFSTKCRVKVAEGLSARQEDAGGRTAVTVVRELHIPVSSAAVEPGDIAVMTAIDDTSDPTLAGATLVLDGPAPGSQTTARRLQVSEVIA